MPRTPFESETSQALMRYLCSQMGWIVEGTKNGAYSLCGIYNDATNPSIIRDEFESTGCSIVAKACRNIKDKLYNTDYCTIITNPDGTWTVKK